MTTKSTLMFVCAAAFCAAAMCDLAAAAPPKTQSAQEWLAEVPPLPGTADGAYAQWTDISGNLKPGPAFQRVGDGIKEEVLMLSRPMQPAVGSRGPLSSRDQALVEHISVFPETARVLQSIQAARTAHAALLQKWHAELNALEQRRLLERSALPACHNEAGAPSQAAIRDVEQSFAQRKIEIAAQYLAKFQPLVDQLRAAVSPRIKHGDAAMAAWTQLRNPDIKAQLAPVARGTQSDALLDVGLVQEYIQDISKLAAKSVADRNALGRVYAHAKGC